jgi:hypothetical protein
MILPLIEDVVSAPSSIPKLGGERIMIMQGRRIPKATEAEIVLRTYAAVVLHTNQGLDETVSACFQEPL